MIRHWYEPPDFIEWLKRVFSLMNIALVLLTAFLVFSEFRFNWFETLVGNYLAATNQSRPETGAIWETGRHASRALDHLEELAARQEDTRSDVAKARSFSQLANGMKPGQWVVLDRAQLKQLYLSLERTAAGTVMEPVDLVWLLNSTRLERIFCEGRQSGITLYFIDAQNRVIRQVSLDHDRIAEIEKSDQAVAGSLSDMDGFKGRIYPAGQFFEAVFSLPGDMVPDLIQNPEVLLKQAGRISRVGIWDQAENGYIRLGFEFQAPGQTKLILLRGREWAVWQLSLNLKGGLEDGDSRILLNGPKRRGL